MKYLGFVLLVLSSSTTALADTDTYISLNVGASIVDDAKGKESSLDELSTRDISDITYNYNFGHTISAALGVSFGNGYRVEVEVANQINDLVGASRISPTNSTHSKFEEVDITVSTLLANAYKDFYIVDKFFGYVSGGIGVAYNELDARSYVVETEVGTSEKSFGRFDDTVLSWQLGVGLGYELTKEIDLNVGYRYLGTDDVNFNASYIHTNNNYIIEFGSHNVTAGIRYSF
jgi:opacity protein-like surface antigen